MNDSCMWLISKNFIKRMLQEKSNSGNFIGTGTGIFMLGDEFESEFILNELSKINTMPFYSDFVEKNKHISCLVTGIDMTKMEFIRK